MSQIFENATGYFAATPSKSFVTRPGKFAWRASSDPVRLRLKAFSNDGNGVVYLKGFEIAARGRKITVFRNVFSNKTEFKMKEAQQALLQMKSLGTGWNGYTAQAPTVVAIEIATSLLEKLNDIGITPMPRVSPSVVGGVGFSFRRGSRRIYIEVRNCGTTHAIFSDDSDDINEPNVIPVRTDDTGLRLIAESIQEDFHVNSAAVPS